MLGQWLLSVKEAASYPGVSPCTVFRLKRKGDLPSIRGRGNLIPTSPPPGSRPRMPLSVQKPHVLCGICRRSGVGQGFDLGCTRRRQEWPYNKGFPEADIRLPPRNAILWEDGRARGPPLSRHATGSGSSITVFVE